VRARACAGGIVTQLRHRAYLLRVAAEDVVRLLVSCPDTRGIVAAISAILFGRGANVVLARAVAAHLDDRVLDFENRTVVF